MARLRSFVWHIAKQPNAFVDGVMNAFSLHSEPPRKASFNRMMLGAAQSRRHSVSLFLRQYNVVVLVF